MEQETEFLSVSLVAPTYEVFLLRLRLVAIRVQLD